MKYLLLVVHQCIVTPARGLQKDTFSLSLPDRLRSQHSSDSLIEDLERCDENCSISLPAVYLLESSLSESGALEILDRPYFVCQFLALLSLDGRVAVVRQSLESLLVLPQVYFSS